MIVATCQTEPYALMMTAGRLITSLPATMPVLGQVNLNTQETTAQDEEEMSLTSASAPSHTKSYRTSGLTQQVPKNGNSHSEREGLEVSGLRKDKSRRGGLGDDNDDPPFTSAISNSLTTQNTGKNQESWRWRCVSTVDLPYLV